MSGSVEKAALELRTGGMAIVADEHGGTLVLGALFATGRVIEFIDREARGPVCLALPTVSGGGTVTPLVTSGTLPQLDRRADAVRSVAEALAGGRPLPTPVQLSPLSGDEGVGVERPAVSVARLDSTLRLASLAGLSGAAILCPIRGESGAPVGPNGLAAFGRRHDLPAVDAAAILDYGARRIEPRLDRRRPRSRPRVLARATGFAQRLVAPAAPERA